MDKNIQKDKKRQKSSIARIANILAGLSLQFLIQYQRQMNICDGDDVCVLVLACKQCNSISLWWLHT